MTVHDPDLIDEIKPLLEAILNKSHEWTKFAHSNDRDFAAAARWLAHHPKSPMFERIRPRTLAIQWQTTDGGWTVNRTTTDPVRTPDGGRIGRIRFRTVRTPRTQQISPAARRKVA